MPFNILKHGFDLVAFNQSIWAYGKPTTSLSTIFYAKHNTSHGGIEFWSTKATVRGKQEISSCTIMVDVWCQYDVDAKWQLHRNNALVSESHGPTPKPDIYCILDVLDLAAIETKSMEHHTSILGYLSAGRRKMCHQKANWLRNAKQKVYFSFMSTLLMMSCGPAPFTLNWFPVLLFKGCNTHI